MTEKSILSEKLEDNKAAAEWMKQAELIQKSEAITQRLVEKYIPIILSRNMKEVANCKNDGSL